MNELTKSPAAVEPDWSTAIARARDTWREAEEFHASRMLPANRAHADGRTTMEQVSAVEDQYGELCDAHADALEELGSMPAPSLSDLAEKMELLRRAGMFASGDAEIAVVIDDIRRLGGAA